MIHVPLRRIVRSESGPGTAETIYTDDQGERWRRIIGAPTRGGTTGNRVATVLPDGIINVQKL